MAWEWLRKLIQPPAPLDSGLGPDVLAQRLNRPLAELQALIPRYHEAVIPKRTGGVRRLAVPDEATMALQRAILRRLLRRLKAHDAAHAFERGRSILTHARPHVGRPVVVTLDLEDFFGSTTASRIEKFFLYAGWNRTAADLLTRLTTHEGKLPQGAPTSPRLSNLANRTLDAAMQKVMARTRGDVAYGRSPRTGEPLHQAHARNPATGELITLNIPALQGVYTRYADDLCFSFAFDDGGQIRHWLQMIRFVLEEFGYRINRRKKVRILRQHQRQKVAGLVVNRKANLPRQTRRRLRAIEHRLAQGRPATLRPEQLRGWVAYRRMIEG